MNKIINKLISENVRGADTYYYNGSFWLIFTDRLEWIVELKDSGVLLYNFEFFHNLYQYVSLDVVKNQHYITEWFENVIQKEVNETRWFTKERPDFSEDIIHNGIVGTFHGYPDQKILAKTTIQKGKKL
jgi:hypothetical protein